jgi:hypothetical protein
MILQINILPNSGTIEKTKLQASPIVPARTKTILKLMEVIGIPYNDCSPHYLRNERG